MRLLLDNKDLIVMPNKDNVHFMNLSITREFQDPYVYKVSLMIKAIKEYDNTIEVIIRILANNDLFDFYELKHILDIDILL